MTNWEVSVIRGFTTRLLMLLATVAMMLSLSIIRAPGAEATASGCSGGSCVYVRGTGLYVDYVKGGLTLAAGATTVGHNEIWGSGFHLNNYDTLFHNSNTFANVFWHPQTHYIRRNLPDGSKVCSRFWVKLSGGGYYGRGIACVTIRR